MSGPNDHYQPDDVLLPSAEDHAPTRLSQDMAGLQQQMRGIQRTLAELARNGDEHSLGGGSSVGSHRARTLRSGTIPESLSEPTPVGIESAGDASQNRVKQLFLENAALADRLRNLQLQAANQQLQAEYIDDAASYHSHYSQRSHHSQRSFNSVPHAYGMMHPNVRPVTPTAMHMSPHASPYASPYASPHMSPHSYHGGGNAMAYRASSSMVDVSSHIPPPVLSDTRSMGSSGSISHRKTYAQNTLSAPTRPPRIAGRVAAPRRVQSGWGAARAASPDVGVRRVHSFEPRTTLPFVPLTQPVLVPTQTVMSAQYPHLHPETFSNHTEVDAAPMHNVPQDIIVDPNNELWAPSVAGDARDDRSLVSGDGSTLPTRRFHSAHSMQAHRPGAAVTVASTSYSGSNASFSRSPAKQYADPIDDYERDDNPPGSRFWKSLSVAMTCIVPDRCIPKQGAGPKLAWREKVTICLIVFFVSLAIVGGIGFLPIFLCRSSGLYTQNEINKQRGEAWITIFGTIYNVRGLIDSHPGGSQGIRDYLGKDASHLFPRPPPTALLAKCLDTSKNSSMVEDVGCPLLEDSDYSNANNYCHTSMVGIDAVHEKLGGHEEGKLVIPPWTLAEDQDEDKPMSYLIIDKSIYDVSHYINALRDEKTKVFSTEPSHPNAYLFEDLHNLIISRLNEDATAAYDAAFQTNDFKICMDKMFYHARVDDRYDAVCSNIGVAMYFLLFVVTFMMLIQVFCSLLYLARRHPQFTADDKSAAVMIMVPCYNETDKELLKTIDSVLLNDYPEENKLLMVVADGVITGSGATASTPEILGQILGFEFDCMDEAYEYKSLGKNTRNYISVYAGVYEKKIGNGTRRLKYMVLVKQGSMAERGSGRAGNRGKRDSQLVITGMLNRMQHNREPAEVDVVVRRELEQLDIPLKDIEYMMAIDADTRVHRMAMQHMVYHLERNKTVLACCGETQVDNKAQSWVTMMQVFEYFSSHHMKKAFESVFGCVTCLPGCFTMYRLFTEEMDPLISADIIFQEYSRNDIQSLHEKNLYELGEDRMLTTLLLQHFAGMKLSFVPEAICWTIVPHTFSILLSQRRRWINSTLHNMFELLKVETMCGICCISMKTIVIADLLATMILPASIAYLGYLAYLFITQPEMIDPFVVYFYAVTIILMMLPFLIRSRWDYFFWFIMYVLFGIPTFYFILPLYSFVHMDDFSWGKTRMVSGGDAAAKPATTETEAEPKALDTDDAGTKKNQPKGAQSAGDASSWKPSSARDDTEVNTDFGTAFETETGDSGSMQRSVARMEAPPARLRTMATASTISAITPTTRGLHSHRSKERRVEDQRPQEMVNAISVATSSGEILVYFQQSKQRKQPNLAPLVDKLVTSDAMCQKCSIDAILTRADPVNPDIPLTADPLDPEESEVWFVFVCRAKTAQSSSYSFRKQYAESLCTVLQGMHSNIFETELAFQFGKDITPPESKRPLGDYITNLDVVAYIQDIVHPNDGPSGSSAIGREAISTYFGKDRINEIVEVIANLSQEE